jgi:hypothetical protein
MLPNSSKQSRALLLANASLRFGKEPARTPSATRVAATTTLPADSGVAVADALEDQGTLTAAVSTFAVTDAGAARLNELGVRTHSGEVARECLDWTEQRRHIAGPLGRALLTRLLELGWLARDPSTRALRVTDTGRTNLPQALGVRLP